jgi:heme exporter protein A
VKLAAHDLACRRGGRLLFTGLGFALGPGEALVVTGRNGAGKSSLLAILAGTIAPEAGRLAWEGIDDDEPARFMHVVGHRDALKTPLTAAENLAFAGSLLGGDGDPRAALQAVGLAHIADLPVGYLSAGQRRRVALARLLVAKRPLWLLDEPNAALDGASTGLLAGLMRDHLAAGGLIVAATHAPLGLENARTLRIGP